MSADPAEPDYRDSVFLPRTEFPMRANLPAREPAILERWLQQDLYRQLREDSRGRPKFVLHDGPPYANGNIHVGHAVNKILKDIVTRTRQMLGHDSNYVPGWDCHGLPIEWKIEEQYRAQGRSKDQVDPVTLRRDCRDFARHWVTVQTEEFRRLGVLGDWTSPYTTMTPKAEAAITAEIHRVLKAGLLYKGLKPVLWSVVERTALAEAEVEYQEHRSTQIWVRFPVAESPDPSLAGAAVLIWTTTPWTIPANRAICFGPEIAYGLFEVTGLAEGSHARIGERVILAQDLAAPVMAAAKIAKHRLVQPLTAEHLTGLICRHPLHGQGYDFTVPMLPGEHVTAEAGTGFVHTAPSHGEDDFEVGQRHGLETPDLIDDAGRYRSTVPLFAGAEILTPDGKEGDANRRVVTALIEAGTLWSRAALRHDYPHSWRSKAPLIYRATPQWFIGMERDGLRDRALDAIGRTRWFPPESRNRLQSMIASRPDWCISRQRAWGVPIALFVSRATGDVLDDPAVLDRITRIFAEESSDAWFTRPPADFLGPDHDPEEYEQVRDIVDVWFESGSTHAFVLEQRPDLHWPADLYLEGSDQHRGWFQSSLLEGVATRGEAPFRSILTHGFTMDEQGRKFSKSLGNGVAPQDVIKEYGADILRLWVVSSDYSQDQRIGKEILKQVAETYRRLRNSLRYLLGALDGFTEAERITGSTALPLPERWIRAEMHRLDGLLRACLETHDYTRLMQELHNFCANQLSAVYFDLRKDSLYCDAPTSPRRRAVRTVMAELLDWLTLWLAPVLVFTAEEAWAARPMAGTDGREASVHQRLLLPLPEAWEDPATRAEVAPILAVRPLILGALEIERQQHKRIGSALEAAPVLHVPPGAAGPNGRSWLEVSAADLALWCLTSDLTVTDRPAPDGAFTLPELPGLAVTVPLAAGARCGRCWRHLPEVGQQSRPGLCRRCDEALPG